MTWRWEEWKRRDVMGGGGGVLGLMGGEEGLKEGRGEGEGSSD